ncbi:MAG TPA: ABC transporter ATP-binding protein [Candidatus Ornithomonoglobus intestinigallinarum]|uniref:ABC transporter ATP-binding protein n=1 Tax=Candidatus Ornithomonoglobus intestinigallinarum TaxID=2840894 RepID=A0A9D1H4A3_9FIRM|nr:ABC transporter ATP-binding protein [Candidatus Ornithomonoglobus intestinigallinarum]
MKNKRTFKLVWKYIARYRALLIATLLLAAVTVMLTLYIPILAGRAIDNIIGAGNVRFAALIKVLAQIGAAAVIAAAGQWVMNMINNKITYSVVSDIREDAFGKIERLPLSFIDSHTSGDIVSRVIADADQFADGLLMGFTQLFTGVMTILGTLIFMFGINVWIALVVVVLTPMSLLVARFIASRTYSMFRKQSETRAEQTSLIDELINNLKIVKAFSREEKSIEEFDEINNRLYGVSLKAIFYSSITNPGTRFVNNIVYAVVGLVGAVCACMGIITVGSLTSMLAYATQYTKPFNEISEVVTELQNAVACAERLLRLIHERTERPDDKNAVELENVKGDVELKNVSFSYDPKVKLIENLNVSAASGQRVAIVGPTGCGKTTMINLLMRFYDVNGGAVSVDGTDIRGITRNSLRASYGMVLQDTWLKAGTIRENITMGKPDATEEEIIAAAKAAHSYGFIRRMEKGLDTVIGEDGGSLSQGQKQLLCITRVMLALPPMLILDEATSSIDTRTEIKIQKAFAVMMQGRTSFIVAHRLSTIREADVILVMNAGKIIEQGTHEELMAKGGFYSELYNSQFEAPEAV